MVMDSTEAGGGPIPDDDMILVVDDDERTSRLERFVLEEEGYSVTCAGSGEEALEMLARTPASLVLLDIMLPKMDGFTTCQKIRENSQVPIIMLTGEGRDEEKIRGLEMGADDYITKPFSVNELTARVRAVLRRSSTVRSKNGSARPSSSEPDISFLEDRAKNNIRHSKEISQKYPGESDDQSIDDLYEGALEDDGSERSPVLGEDQADEEFYEGAVKLIVETKGAIKNMVAFVDALREYPEFHLLRMVSNARRDGMDVWLRLREPIPLRTTLLAAKGVTKVEALESAEIDPETGAETDVLRVSLD
ncbi:MAG: hypothetical protein BZY87_06330 [SAR202 cluster bacterium Io17-Chloro-G6]|nr:MAG: hypothetical protein BZY87_06330 [SAR202 cluster bacterium Io17-Chloro-G6]